MIKIYAAGNVDDGANDEVLYLSREEARMALFLDFEWDNQTDSANFVHRFEVLPEERMRELVGSDLSTKPEEIEFLVMEELGAPYYYVREIPVYASTEERYADLENSPVKS